MLECTQCIYRKPNTFKVCTKICNGNVFCNYHKKHIKDVYEIFDIIFGKRNDDINVSDIYRLFVYVSNYIKFNTDDIEHIEMVKIFFIELLKKIPKKMLSKTFLRYNITKKNLYNHIYILNYTTNQLSKHCNINRLLVFARNMIANKLVIKLNDINVPINTEDPFTYDKIEEIAQNELFTYRDNNNSIYAFNALELDYFVYKCRKDGISPYNPYTREVLNEYIIKKLNIFINYNKLQRRDDECRWQTELHAFTDLSFEIEKRGFYNSPEWFIRMDKSSMLKTIKLFKNFSADIHQNNKYYNININDIINTSEFVYEFCKEGMRMFQECSEDLYILCCNFMKALAMCSKDFYDNLPDWLIGTNTSSRLSDIYAFLRDDTIDNNIFRRNDFRQNRFLSTNNDNFLLYYYVEYMQ